jgi:hypothetical protein
MRTDLRYVYVGHHKCASGYICNVLETVAETAGISVSPRMSKREPEEYATIARDHQLLLLDNWFGGRIDLAAFPHRGFHVVRDPRDIAISQYYSHRDSHPPGPWLTEERTALRRLPEREGIAAVMNGRLLTAVLEEMAAWDYGRPDMLETSFERLTTSPRAEWERIFAFLGLDRLDDALTAVLAGNRFERLRELQPGHYRDGRTEQWRALPEELLGPFMERWGPLVERLGYPLD